MRELQYHLCVRFRDDYKTIANEMLTPDIIVTAWSFEANIKRVYSLGQVPLEVNYWSGLFSSCITRASIELGKFPPMSAIDDDVLTLANRYVDEQRSERAKVPDQMFARHFATVAGGNLRSLMREDASGELLTAHETILSSMIVEAWAAFESLAVELWVTVVNLHPRVLGAKVGQANKEKSIPLDLLASYNFDLSQRLGSILYENGRVKFDNFNEIKRNFATLFGADMQVLFTKHSEVFIVEQLRHIIAHRSGVIDDKFLKNVESAGFVSLRKGTRFELTGNIVAKQVDEVVRCAVDLLRFVDVWSANERVDQPSG